MAAKPTAHFYDNENCERNGNAKGLACGSAVASNSASGQMSGTLFPTVSIDAISSSPLKVYALRLGPGEELRKSLLEVVEKKGLQAVFVMTCVGSASSAQLRPANHRAGETAYILDLIEPLEIVSLTGTLNGSSCHLHTSLANKAGKVFGGHLVELIVDTTAEIVLGECTELSFVRDHDERTGFNELLVFPR